MAESNRPCPACNAPMNPHEARGLRLDVCAGCGGVWFDAGEFGRISRGGSRAVESVVAEEPPDLKAVPSTQLQHCPVCGVVLNRYAFAGSGSVMLDGCPQCAGIYLSRQDLLGLDARDRLIEMRDGKGLGEEVAADVGLIDAEVAANLYTARLAQYNWQQLMNPVMFS